MWGRRGAPTFNCRDHRHGETSGSTSTLPACPYLTSDLRLNSRLILGRSFMQRINKFTHAAKVVAWCLPPVVMSLIGLAARSRKKDGAAVVAGKNPAPTAGATRRSGAG